jgi:tripartite-type tricarboxylate transporter receptor subunit TctC
MKLNFCGTRKMIAGLACMASLLAATVSSYAADYPNRPVRLLIGFAAGGSSDVVLRILGEHLSNQFGQPFVVDNRPGAGGNIAGEALVNSKPDGYTFMLSGTSYAVGDSMYRKLPYNFLRDATPVAMLTEGPNMMLVSNSLPVKNVQEFIDYCKANPGKLSFASSGSGTSLHMSGELFKAMTKCDMEHIPYRASGQMIPDLISGQVQVIFNNLPSSIVQVQAGKVRGLAVTAAKRWPGLPDMPAISETVPGYEAMSFYSISGPKGLPPEIVETINQGFNKALTDPKVVARLNEFGLNPRPMSKEEFAKYYADQTEKWKKVVEFSGAYID